jgi:hypothetical protein
VQVEHVGRLSHKSVAEPVLFIGVTESRHHRDFRTALDSSITNLKKLE